MGGLSMASSQRLSGAERSVLCLLSRGDLILTPFLEVARQLLRV
jgi:hypothetical protein